MHVAEAGPDDGPAIVLCHGFPECWYSWRHQLQALGDAGYHVLTPDQRGYGTTDRPTGRRVHAVAPGRRHRRYARRVPIDTRSSSVTTGVARSRGIRVATARPIFTPSPR